MAVSAVCGAAVDDDATINTFNTVTSQRNRVTMAPNSLNNNNKNTAPHPERTEIYLRYTTGLLLYITVQSFRKYNYSAIHLTMIYIFFTTPSPPDDDDHDDASEDSNSERRSWCM